MTIKNDRGKRFLFLALTLLLCLPGATAKAATETGLWDFVNHIPSSLTGIKIEGTSDHVLSNNASVNMYVIAKSGKFAVRTSDAQVNANTYLRIVVRSTSDKVTIVSCTGYHNFKINGTAATSDNVTHTATANEVSQGFVEILSTGTTYLKSLKVERATATSSNNGGSSSSSTDNSTTGSGNFTAVTQNYYQVAAGSASGLLQAIAKANAASSSSRKYIFLPNGTYDLGTTCLTAITGDHISIIGQSMDGTIIKNKPSVSNEGIGTTATLLNKGNYNYLQDLTLENDLDYYNASSAGRAVAWQDKGNYTILKRVRLKSYQDTYYSNNASGLFYFEDSYIHGCVDFICGGGDVFFNHCNLIVEPRTKNGSGSCVIAAPYTQSNWGYVFNGCTINNKATAYSLGRAWGGTPRLAYINTKVNDTKIVSSRFTAEGMNVVAKSFKEYNTTNNGRVVSPSSNIISFTKGSTVNRMETILSGSEAKQYALNKVFSSWTPNKDASQLNMSAVKQNGSAITWPAVSGASSYAVFRDGSLVQILSSGKTTLEISKTGTYSVRASNPMGGFGNESIVKVTSLGSSTSSSDQSVKLSSDARTLSGNNDFVVTLKSGAYMGYDMIVLPKGKAAQMTVTSKHSNRMITGIDFTWRIAPGSGSLSANYGTMNGTATWKASSGGLKSVRFTATGTSNSILTSMTIHYSENSSNSSNSSSSSSSSSASSTYDLGKPVGWATVGGTVTGGAGKNTVVVTTANDLIEAMSGTEQRTIYVKGTLSFSGQLAVKDAANKTVLGLPGSKLVNSKHSAKVAETGILYLTRCKNMILRNLTFQGAGAYDIDGYDNLTISGSTYIWVDHCDFLDGVDGNFDCNNASDNIAVTWCRFHYTIAPWAGGSGGSNDHRFSDLWGGSDKNISKDGGKLRTTFANCWWDEGCRERMPRVRFGQIHIVNCLYSSSVANYCIGTGYRSNIYVEKSAFTTSKTQKGAWRSCATSSGYTDYNIQLKGCQGVSDGSYRSGSQSYFNPYSNYSYTSFDASLVASVVGNASTGAGATLHISQPSAAKAALTIENATVTDIKSVSPVDESVRTVYFTLDGRQVANPGTGLFIVKTYYQSGKVKVTKRMY